MIRTLSKFRFSNFIQKMMEITKRTASQPESTSQNALAERVLNQIGKGAMNVEYQAKLRARVTLQSQMQELEKELKQEIARALKNTEQKLIYRLKVAQKAFEHLNELKQSNVKWEGKHRELLQDYHKLLKQCETARYQLIVHRHSVGFTIRNHETVYNLYPLPSRFQI